MPILSRTQTSVPLPVEGEYAGIARKVSFSYSQEGVGTMRVPLYDPWGRLIATATLLDTDKARWTYGGLIKSGELQIPDGIENFTIDASDTPKHLSIPAGKPLDFYAEAYGSTSEPRTRLGRGCVAESLHAGGSTGVSIAISAGDPTQ